METFVSILILGFATWRLTYMFTDETGPYRVFERIRAVFITPLWYGQPTINGKVRPPDAGEPKNIIGQILDCFYCASVWFGFLLTLVYCMIYSRNVYDVFFLTFAASGMAILLEENRRGKSE